MDCIYSDLNAGVVLRAIEIRVDPDGGEVSVSMRFDIYIDDIYDQSGYITAFAEDTCTAYNDAVSLINAIT